MENDLGSDYRNKHFQAVIPDTWWKCRNQSCGIWFTIDLRLASPGGRDFFTAFCPYCGTKMYIPA